MTLQQNRPLDALPNVLHDQTAPNTLGGIGQPRRAPTRARTLDIVQAVVAAAIVAGLLLLALARFGTTS